MKKPAKRIELPPRRSDNDKRRLHPAPPLDLLVGLRISATYHPYPKHKRDPVRFGLAHYTGARGGETLCDEHANFEPNEMPGISDLLARGIRAGLVGHIVRQQTPTIIWTVADSGWIFEGRITNIGQTDYHGYPVRPSEAIAAPVYRRFHAWAETTGEERDRKAARACLTLYGFKDGV